LPLKMLANKNSRTSHARCVWRVNLGETAARSKWDAAADWQGNDHLDSFLVQDISDCRCLIDAGVPLLIVAVRVDQGALPRQKGARIMTVASS